MEAEQKPMDHEIVTEHKPDEDRDDTFSVFFYELLSELRY